MENVPIEVIDKYLISYVMKRDKCSEDRAHYILKKLHRYGYLDPLLIVAAKAAKKHSEKEPA